MATFHEVMQKGTMKGGTGDDVYVFDSDWSGKLTIKDTGGNDTVDLSAMSRDVVVRLSSGPGPEIEIAGDGTGNDTHCSIGDKWNFLDHLLDSIFDRYGHHFSGRGNNFIDSIIGKGAKGKYCYSGDRLDFIDAKLDKIFDKFGHGHHGRGKGIDGFLDMSLLQGRIWGWLHGKGGGKQGQVSQKAQVNWDNDSIENVLTGSGNDDITGNARANLLNSGAGNDIIRAGDGNDTLIGGAGNDTLDGGSGNDTYRFAQDWGQDTVTDSSGQDTLDFSGVTTDVNVDLLNQWATDAGNMLTWTGMIEDVITGSGHDILTGNAADNLLQGGDGNDTYRMADNGGRDVIVDSGGNDTLDLSLVAENGATVDLNAQIAAYGANAVTWDNNAIENVIGTATDDMLTGNAGDNQLQGGAGHDTLIGGTGNDTLDGGEGDDTYLYDGNWGHDTIVDSGGRDFLDFSTSTNNLTVDLTNGLVTDGTNTVTIQGDLEMVVTGSGDDVLVGNLESNILNGGDGNDTYRFHNFWLNDTIIDSGGEDTIDFSPMLYAGVNVNLVSRIAEAEAWYGSHTIQWEENAIEHVIGTHYGDLIMGNNVNNRLIGGEGDDTLMGGMGDDTLDGGTWHDTYVFNDNWGHDVVYESNGRDTFDFGSVTANMTVDLLNRVATDGFNTVTWTTDIEHATTGSGNDVLTGSLVNNILNGGGGDDTYIFSNYWLEDIIIDSSGVDTIDFSRMRLAGVNVNLTSNDEAEAWYGPHSINWENDAIEHVIATHMADILAGNNHDNRIEAGDGNDTISGGGGNDTLLGGTGHDLYHGFADDFGSDIISDASGGLDILDLSQYTLSQVASWQAVDSNGDTFVDSLAMDFAGGNQILIENYFNNTSTDDDTSDAGTGLIEKLVFADDGDVNFVQVQQLIV